MSRFLALGELGVVLSLAPLEACGFVDGDPILAGATSSAGSGSGSGSAAAETRPGGSEDATIDAASAGGSSGASDTADVADCECSELAPSQRCLRFINACDIPVWAGASGDVDPPAALAAIPRPLPPGSCEAVAVTSVVGGRAWGAVDCVDDVCASDGSSGRGTLIQFTLPEQGIANYDVSLVDGFNLPMAIRPTGEGAEACVPAICAEDLNASCPEGQRRHAEGSTAVAWCESICRACNACPPTCDTCPEVASVCCTPEVCGANERTALWDALCPDAIAYSGEGSPGCSVHTDFDIIYCP